MNGQTHCRRGHVYTPSNTRWRRGFRILLAVPGGAPIPTQSRSSQTEEPLEMEPSIEPIFSDFSSSELRDCARRELTQRQRTYRHLVNDGKMTPNTAEREISMMWAIVEHFDEFRNPRLF
jgi:hypothetical protein